MPEQIPNFKYQMLNAKPIEYQETDLSKDWQDYNIQHELTDKGIEKFAQDWNALIQ